LEINAIEATAKSNLGQPTQLFF